MRFREVPAEDLSLNPMTMIGGGWWLIGTGNEEAGYNAWAWIEFRRIEIN